MNPRQLFIEQDGDHVHYGWACSKCRAGFIALEPAEKCCAPGVCVHCGVEVPNRYHVACSSCRDLRKLERILAGELERIEDVGDAMLTDPFGDEWFDELGSWVEWEAERIAEWGGEPLDVLELGEPVEFSLDVERWVEGEEEEHYSLADWYSDRLTVDYADAITQAQVLLDQISAPTLWMPSGRYVDVRPLHAEVLALVQEDCDG